MSVDLRTRYLGLELSSPVVASASPLNEHVDSVRDLVAAGAGAVVMPSLFEEEVLHDELGIVDALEVGAHQVGEAVGYFPDLPGLVTTADRYVRTLAALKAAVDVPVVASLNAAHPGSWERYAVRLVEAGADAVELNLYSLAADPRRSGTEIEAENLAAIAMVREAVDVPVAVKLSPFFSSFAHFAHAAVDAGADGLVLFNRFYQPDIDLDTMEVVPHVDLSSSVEIRLPLRWIAILRPQLPSVSLAATSGIGTGRDAAKVIAAGADVAMITSAILREGPSAVSRVINGLARWLDDHEYESVGQLRGSMSYAATDDPTAFERANYRKVLHSWSTPS